jgi:hypothetical protein
LKLIQRRLKKRLKSRAVGAVNVFKMLQNRSCEKSGIVSGIQG